MKRLLNDMKYNYYGTVTDNIACNKLMKMYKNDQVFILDISTEGNGEFISIPFATIIPLHDLPKRLDKLPRDKTIAVYCCDPEVEHEAYTFLQKNGFDVKIVLENFYSSFDMKPTMLETLH